MVDLGDDGVFLFEDVLEFGGEGFLVEEVADADAVAGGFVGVGGADAAAGGADGLLAAGLFLEGVEGDVVGHYEVGAFADVEFGGVDAALVEGLHFVGEDVGVDDDAVADDAVGVGPADAGGD